MNFKQAEFNLIEQIRKQTTTKEARKLLKKNKQASEI